MKAVVLEIRDGYAAVLREDGVVEKLRRDGRVGETIELNEAGRVTRFPKAGRWVAAAAAALVIVSAGGGWGYNNAYAYSYVTLDANPSIEYTLNRRNRIIAVEALNEDGAALVEEVASLKNASLTDGLAAVTDALYAQDYLGEDTENCLLLSVTSRGETQQAALTEELDAYFAARAEEDGDLQVYVTSATRAEARQAAELGVSAGKYVVARDIAQREGVELGDMARFENETVGRLLEGKGVRAPREEASSQSGPARSEAEPSGEPAAEAMTQAPAREEPGDSGPAQDGPGREETASQGGPEEAPATDGQGGPSGEPSR